LGVVLYAIQARLFSTGRTDWFDLSNPFGAFPRNLFHFIRVFVRDSAPSWLVLMALVFIFAIATLIAMSRQSLLRTLLVIPIYLVISVLASGGILLFATAEHISVQARFRFPLAMGIGMLAIIASVRWDTETVTMPRAWPLIANVALGVFAYLWLVPVFLFANTLTEQNEALRFQSRLMFADAFSFYRPGDVIVYDTNIFTNSLYAQRVGERFPIFDNSTYVGQINLHSDTVRDRLNEMLGFSQGVLFATNDLPEACAFRNPGTEVLAGPRWEAWRSNDHTVCLTFPEVAEVEVNTRASQTITLDLNRFPFSVGNRPATSDLTTTNLQIAVWSLTNPGDVQWLNPTELNLGIATFIVPAPPAGWHGNLIVAHYFLDDVFMFQQIWQLPDD